MPDTDIKLLDNLLDALDRLYDRATTVTDLHALVYATEVALSGSVHTAMLTDAEQLLQRLLRSGKSVTEERDIALNETDDLRKYLAGVVPFP
jgi:hypothetical protein